MGPGRGPVLWAPAGKGGLDGAFLGPSAKLKIRDANTTLSCIRKGGDESWVRGPGRLRSRPSIRHLSCLLTDALCANIWSHGEHGSTPSVPPHPQSPPCGYASDELSRLRRCQQQPSGLLHRVPAESPRPAPPVQPEAPREGTAGEDCPPCRSVLWGLGELQGPPSLGASLLHGGEAGPLRELWGYAGRASVAGVTPNKSWCWV